MPTVWDGGCHMGWMGIWWVLPFLIAAVFWAALKTRSRPDGPRETPEEILKRRYAKGEIDREAYQRMLGDIRGA